MNNLKNITFYIINLDSRKDRWREIVEELKKQDITNYKRFSAIRPTISQILKIPFIDVRQFWRFRSLNNENDAKYCIGASGCKLSHYYLLKNIQKDINSDINNKEIYIKFLKCLILNIKNMIQFIII